MQLIASRGAPLSLRSLHEARPLPDRLIVAPILADIKKKVRAIVKVHGMETLSQVDISQLSWFQEVRSSLSKRSSIGGNLTLPSRVVVADCDVHHPRVARAEDHKEARAGRAIRYVSFAPSSCHPVVHPQDARTNHCSHILFCFPFCLRSVESRALFVLQDSLIRIKSFVFSKLHPSPPALGPLANGPTVNAGPSNASLLHPPPPLPIVG